MELICWVTAFILMCLFPQCKKTKDEYNIITYHYEDTYDVRVPVVVIIVALPLVFSVINFIIN